MTSYDTIVIGLGGIGSATCAALAERGLRVLAIDRFTPPHDRGSSHGATRIIRRAYFEHPDYVPLVNRAYARWQKLEESSGQSLLTQCGLLQIGPPDGAVLPGVLESVRRHGLEAECWNAAETRRRFPQFAVPDAWSAVWEPGAGFLAVERCVATCLDEAKRHGAELQFDTTVTRIESHAAGVTVETSKAERLFADQVVVAPGPWGPELLSDTGLSLTVLKKHLHWFQAPQSFQLDSGFPTFLVETPEGIFYGFPAIDERGLKVAEHSGGEPVSDPLAADRSVDRRDRERVKQFLETSMPTCSTSATGHAVCFYTMTPDEHFVVDRHPRWERVWIAAGFSGHGFKFAPAIAEALADYVMQGTTELPVGFLRIRRRGKFEV